MKRVLVYVDAENISSDKFEDFLEMLDEELMEEEMVIGKFYGNSKILGGIVQECYVAGFEFVDTSVLVSSKKNVADMKIAVDCIMDAMSVYQGEVARVYLVSSDHDFVPLAYKLTGQRVKVISPFLEDAISQKTCTDLTKFLDGINFNPVMQGTLLETPFQLFRDLVGDEFSEELICIYLDKKRKKIAKCVFGEFGTEVAERILAMSIKTFCFQKLLIVLKPSGQEGVLNAFNVYTQKMYGVCLPANEAVKIIGGVCIAGH